MGSLLPARPSTIFMPLCAEPARPAEPNPADELPAVPETVMRRIMMMPPAPLTNHLISDGTTPERQTTSDSAQVVGQRSSRRGTSPPSPPNRSNGEATSPRALTGVEKVDSVWRRAGTNNSPSGRGRAQMTVEDVRRLLEVHESVMMQRLELWLSRQEEMLTAFLEKQAVLITTKTRQESGPGRGTASRTWFADESGPPSGSRSHDPLASIEASTCQASSMVDSVPIIAQIGPALQSTGSPELLAPPAKDRGFSGSSGSSGAELVEAAPGEEYFQPHSSDDGGFAGSKEIQSMFGVRASNVRDRLGRVIDDPDSSHYAQVYEKFDLFLLCLSVIAAVIQTNPIEPQSVGYIVDFAFELLFLVELSIRFWIIRSPKRFFFNPYNLVDIASASPLFLRPLLGCVPWSLLVQYSGETKSNNCYALWACIPLVRLLKMLRRFSKFHLLVKAFILAFDALPFFLFIYMAMVFAFSSILYIVEPQGNIDNYWDAAWLAVNSITTLGTEGPVSWPGKFIVGMLTFISMLYTGIPIGIIGNAFNDVWQDRDRILLMKRTKSKLREKGFTAKDIPQLFKDFDVDQDGALNLNEFLWMLRGMKLGFKKDRVGQLFRTFDDDGSGRIDDREFVRGLFPDAYLAIYGEESENGSIIVGESQRSTLDKKRKSFFGLPF